MKFTIAIASIIAISQAGGSCSIDEERNWFGPGRCQFDYECAGDRYCNNDGRCDGNSNCVGTMPVDRTNELQYEIDLIEQDIDYLKRENLELREAFRQLTGILSGEFL